MIKLKPHQGIALLRYHNHKTAKPAPVFWTPRSVLFNSVPSFHPKYQATLILTHKGSILFLRANSVLENRNHEEPITLFRTEDFFFSILSVSFSSFQSYTNTLRNTTPNPADTVHASSSKKSSLRFATRGFRPIDFCAKQCFKVLEPFTQISKG